MHNLQSKITDYLNDSSRIRYNKVKEYLDSTDIPYNEKDDMWRLSPANDLTYSNTYYGEHTTTVDGNGKNPSVCK